MITAIVQLAILIFVVIGVIFIFSGKARTLIKGFWGKMIEDTSKTPEGADAIYEQAIEQSQNNYNKACENLELVSGKLEGAKFDLKKASGEISELEVKCQRLVNLGRDSDAIPLAQRREELLAECEIHKENIAKLEQACTEAKQIQTYHEQQLTTLKRERTVKVNSLKMNQELSQVYSSMDDLRKTTDLDKLMENVNVGVRESAEKAVGAKVVHENKTSTKVDRVNQSLNTANAQSFLDSLKSGQASSTSNNRLNAPNSSINMLNTIKINNKEKVDR